MAGLVEEIQREALNPAVSVSFLLRKVKVAASKLNLGEVEAWVQHELVGYEDGKVPPYRRLHGRPQALNPYHGWIPILLEDDKSNDRLSAVQLRQPLPSVEDLIAKSTAGFAEMPLPPSVIRALNRGADVEFGRMSIHLSNTQLQGVVDAVRNAILDWALALEKAGISGEGFSFDESEKNKALAGSTVYNIGSIGSFSGVMGSGNTTRDIIVTQKNLADLANVSDQIRTALPELERGGIDRQALLKTLDALDEERSKAKPHRGRLVSFLTDLKQVLIGAAGNITAEGAVSLIAVAMKSLS